MFLAKITAGEVLEGASVARRGLLGSQWLHQGANVYLPIGMMSVKGTCVKTVVQIQGYISKEHGLGLISPVIQIKTSNYFSIIFLNNKPTLGPKTLFWIFMTINITVMSENLQGKCTKMSWKCYRAIIDIIHRNICMQIILISLNSELIHKKVYTLIQQMQYKTWYSQCSSLTAVTVRKWF